MKKVEAIAISVTAAVVCLTIILLVLNYNTEFVQSETAVEQNPVTVIYVPYNSGETFTISTTVEDEPVVEETISAEDQQTIDDAEDAIQSMEEQLDELDDELEDIDDDIDDEEDADEIMDDIDDVEEEAEDILYTISQWNNRLIDIAEADNLRDDLDYLQIQTENILDECNDLEDDAEDLE